MIFLFTDFGGCGPYQGELKAVLNRLAPEIPVIDLLATAPAVDPRHSAYLLHAYWPALSIGDVMLAVVDPGVGTARAPLAVRSNGRWLVGPDNGLLELVHRSDPAAQTYRIDWRPERLSASFHGRDLFAPVAARLARNDPWGLSPIKPQRHDWPDDLLEVIFIDDYGNAFTGLRAATVSPEASIMVGDHQLRFARTFGGARAPFWYENSVGLVELAANGKSVAAELDLGLGTAIRVVP